LFEGVGESPPSIKEGDLLAISAPIDFLGINYYSRLLIQASEGPRRQPGSMSYFDGQLVGPVPNSTYTDMGWEIYPEGLADILLPVHNEYHPSAILVTESGAAFRDIWDGGEQVSDARRVDYHRDHLQALAVALMQGIPIDGYFAWSLIDNFEWAEGYA